jgi:20S proteasome subunit beta 1
MTFVEAREFVIRAVAHAMSRDANSGGIIRLMNITKEGLNREFIDKKDIPVK